MNSESNAFLAFNLAFVLCNFTVAMATVLQIQLTPTIDKCTDKLGGIIRISMFMNLN